MRGRISRTEGNALAAEAVVAQQSLLSLSTRQRNRKIAHRDLRSLQNRVERLGERGLSLVRVTVKRASLYPEKKVRAPIAGRVEVVEARNVWKTRCTARRSVRF